MHVLEFNARRLTSMVVCAGWSMIRDGLRRACRVIRLFPSEGTPPTPKILSKWMRSGHVDEEVDA